MLDRLDLIGLLREAAIGVAGTTLVAAVVGLLVAAGYRWMTTRASPDGMPVLVGLSVVTGYLWYVVLGSSTLVGDVPLDHQFSAGYLLAVFASSGFVASASGRLGDRIACQVVDLTRIDERGEAADAVRSARLAIDVGLPETIEDADGYRPIDASVRRSLSGTTVRLPHGLAVSEQSNRIERHLERDYDVGYANVTMADDGTVDRVLVGHRPTGLGSMLPPRTVALAISADPAHDATLGDPVEIWSAEEESRLVATGTLRSANGSIATVIVDADAAASLSADERYRLVTRPDDPTDGYEFASTLRTVDETVDATTVEPDGPLDGEFAGWLPGQVLVIDRDGDLLTLPDDSETLTAGDELWLLASPDDLEAFDGAPADGEPTGSV
ncbi:TrkA C-terminal domain-containing protein [Natronobeatus ordinarius]|uniref:TrkA C-terminal domain-containing protein n=1 Tax=Natronobeatus ordinarius TaxID=2963433 RepID=UPI0020CD940D|nr:TrkA C-terminal domain-containing protein [Natronobeatus ordinarius]